MKLLVDENLASSLPYRITDLFPGSIHVSEAGLSSVPDLAIWEHAAAQGFSILTKDRDFANLSLAHGAPPKVILLETGNCSTREIENIVRTNAIRFAEFERDEARGLLVLR